MLRIFVESEERMSRRCNIETIPVQSACSQHLQQPAFDLPLNVQFIPVTGSYCLLMNATNGSRGLPSSGLPQR